MGEIAVGSKVRVIADDPMDERVGIAPENRWHIGDEFIVKLIETQPYGVFLHDDKGHTLKIKRAVEIEPPKPAKKTSLERWLEMAHENQPNCRKCYFYVKESHSGYIADELKPTLDLFIEKVWNIGQLFNWIDKADHIRHEAVFGSTTIRMMYAAGRVMITFSRENGTTVSIVTGASDKDGKRSGFQSFDGSIFEMRDAMLDVINNWDIYALKQNDEIWFG